MNMWQINLIPRICQSRKSGTETQLCGTVPGTNEIQDSVSGTDCFPGGGPGPVPTPVYTYMHVYMDSVSLNFPGKNSRASRKALERPMSKITSQSLTSRWSYLDDPLDFEESSGPFHVRLIDESGHMSRKVSDWPAVSISKFLESDFTAPSVAMVSYVQKKRELKNAILQIKNRLTKNQVPLVGIFY